MKIFHIADLHLGKLVQGVYMTNDQRYILEQFIAAIDEEKPDAVIIAGDLYDRSVPPVEAVDLLDDILAEIVLKRKVPVLAIAGNHDSPTRLQFANKLLEASGLHIVGEMSTQIKTVELCDAAGPVQFHLIPFAEPSLVRNALQDDSVKTYDDAMRVTIETITTRMDKNARHVAIAHAFVTKTGEEEENTSTSERPLSIGGSDCVNVEYFEPFHYTALGHLHKAHKVKHERIRYAGSPLKYSVSEANHKKGFVIIDLQADGSVSIENRKLVPKHDLRVVEGKFQELLAGATSEDYVFIRLTDETPVIGAMEQLRTVFPNAMHVERKVFQIVTDDGEPQIVERHKLDDETLFNAFYKEMTGEQPNDGTTQLFKEALQSLLDEEREILEVPTK
ncbi:MAG: exonuclease SbcCD subunit D [Lysinibacillus sp.]